ncbi:MAG: VCBS repeat-containing protein [Chitinophagaceae bacterium]
MQKLFFIPVAIFFVSVVLLVNCNNAKDSEQTTGEKLAAIHCGSCHALPDPVLLAKNAWRENILPVMAKKLGLDYIYEMPLEGSQTQAISVEDFKKIADWYYKNAPDTMPGQNRPPILEVTDLFTVKVLNVEEGQFPSTSYLRIDPGNHWIYAANAFDSTLRIYDNRLKPVGNNLLHGTLIDMDFGNSLQQPGTRQGILTFIGIMNPNDLKTGCIHSFTISSGGAVTSLRKMVDSLPRPVQSISCDMDMNGIPDYLVCGFGNTTGALSWIRINDKGQMEQQVLRALPGAIKAYIDDFNKDGLPDIMVLMAQAQEGIYLFLNQGNGSFGIQQVLSFPAINGSSYFELNDFNDDGYKDILYTCGDNGDYTAGILKNYHGVYIFLNDGANHFGQKYFFPVHGCYKAMARDFDKDGDLDIAAISYFPDTQNQPRESFVYLEQSDNFQFRPYTINKFNEGRWLTMDAGDIDGDGDDDIVLGSLVPPYPGQQIKWKKDGNQKAALLLLENKYQK